MWYTIKTTRVDKMSSVNPNLEESWKLRLIDEFTKPYFSELKKFLVEEKKQHQVYPPSSNIFEAFRLTPFEKVKVVILGQDPYHGDGQAHGLSFSVPIGVKPPPSLQNIFKELKTDVNRAITTNGNLESWAKQGVLLLNATLTVRAKTPGSHQNKGWEQFTDSVIECISEEKSNVVFMLWGSYAQNKGIKIDAKKHLVLQAAHPSPFSAHRGFLGCKHFSKANAYLQEKGIGEIDWNATTECSDGKLDFGE